MRGAFFILLRCCKAAATSKLSRVLTRSACAAACFSAFFCAASCRDASRWSRAVFRASSLSRTACSTCSRAAYKACLLFGWQVVEKQLQQLFLRACCVHEHLVLR